MVTTKTYERIAYFTTINFEMKMWCSITIICGVIIAVKFYIMSVFMQIGEGIITKWIELPETLVAVGLACSINWHKLTTALSKISLLLLVLVALYI
ncbi:hypothetical protein [Liquorilactobacillus capillatus]|nr:hypothetical protein [Liquorilactobacillus capillatus]